MNEESLFLESIASEIRKYNRSISASVSDESSIFYRYSIFVNSRYGSRIRITFADDHLYVITEFNVVCKWDVSDPDWNCYQVVQVVLDIVNSYYLDHIGLIDLREHWWTRMGEFR